MAGFCTFVLGRPSERVAWRGRFSLVLAGFETHPPSLYIGGGVWVVGGVFWVCLGVLGRWCVEFMVFWFRLGIPKGDGAWEIWAWTW